MKHHLLNLGFGSCLLAAMLVGCATDQHLAGPMGIDLPGTPDTSATVPDPNHSGPHQIDLSVNLPASSRKQFCVDPDPANKPKVFVVNKDGKSYLIVEGLPCGK